MSDLFLERGADVSPCGHYRHMLWRRWDQRPPLVFIMLNPSSADGVRDDPTVRLCMGRARRMGYGGIRIVNLFQWRATDPRALDDAADPVGPEAEQRLTTAVQGAGLIIAAWGVHGDRVGHRRPRCCEVAELLAGDLGLSIWAIRLTGTRQPAHPLRIPYEVEPFLWLDRDRLQAGHHRHS